MKRAVLFAGTTIVAACLVAGLTVVQIAQKFAPALALSVSPGNAQANDHLAAVMLAQSGLEADPDALMAFAKRSMGAQALNTPALRHAGLAYSFAGDRESARRIFELGRQFTKRDPAINLWLFEDAIRQGEIESGLRLLDQALRVDTSVQFRIFPVLTQTLANREAAEEFVPIILKKPDWAKDYAAYAVGDDRAAPVLAQIIVDHPETADILSDERQRSLARRLAELKHYELATAAFAIFSGRDLEVSAYTDGYFEEESWLPYDWDLGASGNLSVYEAPEGEGLEFSISGGGGQQTIARRLLRLRPGNYALSTRAEATEGDLADLGLRIAIACAGRADAQIAEMGWFGASGQDLTGAFTVPDNCPMQWIEIRARGQRAQHSGTLEKIRIRKQ